MVQFNLLPDVKLHYVRARHLQRSIIAIAGLATAAALFVLILMVLVVHVFQKKHLSDVNNDIKKYTTQLKSTPELTKILTIQNQLNSLSALHGQKPVTSRLYGYVGQITPAKVSITKLDVDFDQHTIEIGGTADSLATVNIFVDTLKFTTFSTPEGANTLNNAFSSVVLNSFAKSEKDATYTIKLNFDTAIFDSSKTVVLTVPPGKITTRSETEKPADLFKTPPTP